MSTQPESPFPPFVVGQRVVTNPGGLLGTVRGTRSDVFGPIVTVQHAAERPSYGSVRGVPQMDVRTRSAALNEAFGTAKRIARDIDPDGELAQTLATPEFHRLVVDAMDRADADDVTKGWTA